MPQRPAARRAAENEAFLAALAECGNARLAARRLDVHRGTYAKRRARDPGFARRWAAALAAAQAALADRVDRSGDHVVGRYRGRPQLRRHRAGTIGPAEEHAFLVALGGSANVRLAAAATGLSRGSFYHRARHDPDFRAAMRDALRIGYDRLESAVMNRVLRDLDPNALGDGKRAPEWQEAAAGAPLPPMNAEHAMQLLILHRNTCRRGWDHRNAPAIDVSTAELGRTLRRHMRALGLDDER